MLNLSREKTTLFKEMQDELFQKNGKGWFRIVSGSMHPFIEINDRVLVKKVNSSEIKIGDIIIFKSNGVFVTHRVIDLLRQNERIAILQKGDASSYASWIPVDDVVGKVIIIEKKGKFLNLNSLKSRVLNSFLGWKNCFMYQFYLRIVPVKHWLKNKPGFVFLRSFYRFLKKPFSYMHRIITRLLFFPVFFM